MVARPRRTNTKTKKTANSEPMYGALITDMRNRCCSQCTRTQMRRR